MTPLSLNDFQANLATDETLRRALEARFGENPEPIPAAEVVDFATGHGYAFTVNDIQDRLSDADLEGVTGGVLLSSSKTTPTDRPTEDVTFYYNKISWGYTPQSESSSSDASASGKYSK